jgi:hypothetical protein
MGSEAIVNAVLDVELNAFSSGDLIRWIESMIQEHGSAVVVAG